MYNTVNTYNPYDNNRKTVKFVKFLLVLIGLFIIGAIIFFYFKIKNDETFIVTFMDTDGVYSIEAGIKRNTTVKEPVMAEKEGYEFLGWYLDDIKYDFDTPVKSDIYLNTKWFKIDTYEVDEISDEKTNEIKTEQAKQKENGTIKTKTAEEVKKEKENTKPQQTSTPTTSPTSSPSTTPSPTTQPTSSPTPTTTPQQPSGGENNKAVIELSSKNILCNKGSMAKITITVTNGNLKSYTSNNTKLVTLKESAIQPKCEGCKQIDISCLDTGTANITVEADDGTKETGTVTIKESSTIAFTAKNISCTTGETVTTIINSGDGVKNYSSSNTSVATVSDSNEQTNCTGCKAINIKCVKAGTSTLTATSNGGKTATATVTVKDAPLVLSTSSISCIKGQTKKLSITSGTNGVKSYVSSNTTVATVTPSATQPKCTGCLYLDIGCNNTGNATITITANNGETQQTAVTVDDPIEFNPQQLTCNKGESKKLSIISGTSGVKSYVSSNTNIITLTQSPIQPKCLGCVDLNVYCAGTGTAAVIVTGNNGVQSTTTVTVSEGSSTQQTQITFQPTTLTCEKGEIKELTVTLSASTIKSVTSSNTNIIALSKASSKDATKYKLECKKEGTASVNVEANDGTKKSLSVTVTAPTNTGYAATPSCLFGHTLKYNSNNEPYCEIKTAKSCVNDSCTPIYGINQSNPKRCENGEYKDKYKCTKTKADNTMPSSTDATSFCKSYLGFINPTVTVTASNASSVTFTCSETINTIYSVQQYMNKGYTCTVIGRQCTGTEVDNTIITGYQSCANGDKCGWNTTTTTDSSILQFSCPNGGTLDTNTKMCK